MSSEKRHAPSDSYIHGAKLGLAANLAIPTGVATAIAWTTEDWDSADIESVAKYHDLVTNNTRLTTSRAGKFLLKIGAEFAANATGNRSLGYKINGGAVITLAADAGSAAITNPRQNVGIALNLVETDYVEIVVTQDSGAALNLTAGPTTFVEMTWLGY
jgi:hypothetical protein